MDKKKLRRDNLKDFSPRAFGSNLKQIRVSIRGYYYIYKKDERAVRELELIEDLAELLHFSQDAICDTIETMKRKGELYVDEMNMLRLKGY